MARTKSRYPGIYKRGKTWTYHLDGPPKLVTVQDPDTGEKRLVQKRNQITLGGFATEEEAWKARVKREYDLGAGINVNPSHATIASYLTSWLKRRQNIRPSTRITYERYITRQITPFVIGAIPLTKLEPQHIADWHADVLAAGYAATTVHHAHAMLSSALKQAVDWGMVGRNVASAVSAPRIETPQMQTWTPEQMATFLAVSDQHHVAPLWRLALLTGLRRGELLALKWSDIDLERGTLSVQRTLTLDLNGKTVIGETAKSRASVRRISLPASIVTQLRHHQERQAFMKSGPRGALFVDQGLVFPNRTGNYVDTSTIHRWQHQLMQEAGVPPIPLHGFRHTAATFALVMGEHFRQVQAMLGHSTAAMTMDRYSHVTENMQRSFADRIEAAMQAVEQLRRDEGR